MSCSCVSCVWAFFPLQTVGPGGIVRREGKIVTAKMLWRELNNSEDSQRTQAEMSGGYMGVCILFPLTTGVQILISGIKLLSSWEHPVQNSWRSCSQRYGTMLRTDPSMLASLSPNFFQILSSQQTRNTTNSKVCLTKGHGPCATAAVELSLFQFFFSLVALHLMHLAADQWLHGFCSAERQALEMVFGDPGAWAAKGT